MPRFSPRMVTLVQAVPSLGEIPVTRGGGRARDMVESGRQKYIYIHTGRIIPGSWNKKEEEKQHEAHMENHFILRKLQNVERYNQLRKHDKLKRDRKPLCSFLENTKSFLAKFISQTLLDIVSHASSDFQKSSTNTKRHCIFLYAKRYILFTSKTKSKGQSRSCNNEGPFAQHWKSYLR